MDICRQRRDPAHPAAARTVLTKTNDSVHVEITVLCEAARGPSEKFRSDIRSNVEQVSRMSNDPSLKCGDGLRRVDSAVHRGRAREHSNQQLYVQNRRTTGPAPSDSLAVPCLDVGKRLRARTSHQTIPRLTSVEAQASRSMMPSDECCASKAKKICASTTFGCPPPAP